MTSLTLPGGAMKIKDKIAIVTGASAGIGLALARLLAEKGATVILAARSADKLKQLEKEIPVEYELIRDYLIKIGAKREG